MILRTLKCAKGVFTGTLRALWPLRSLLKSLSTTTIGHLTTKIPWLGFRALSHSYPRSFHAGRVFQLILKMRRDLTNGLAEHGNTNQSPCLKLFYAHPCQAFAACRSAGFEKTLKTSCLRSHLSMLSRSKVATPATPTFLGPLLLLSDTPPTSTAAIPNTFFSFHSVSN